MRPVAAFLRCPRGARFRDLHFSTMWRLRTSRASGPSRNRKPAVIRPAQHEWPKRHRQRPRKGASQRVTLAIQGRTGEGAPMLPRALRLATVPFWRIQALSWAFCRVGRALKSCRSLLQCSAPGREPRAGRRPRSHAKTADYRVTHGQRRRCPAWWRPAPVNPRVPENCHQHPPASPPAPTCTLGTISVHSPAPSNFRMCITTAMVSSISRVAQLHGRPGA